MFYYWIFWQAQAAINPKLSMYNYVTMQLLFSANLKTNQRKTRDTLLVDILKDNGQPDV